MNIKEAKIQITNTLRAYLQRDEQGEYCIPAIRQRPVLLMGPPGIGKTQIMQQIAAETGVGLVSYTITHHTRQSAVGLPFIQTRSFDGVEQSVTEYTMSEILASVYRCMEESGTREGILFLDEINCASETLAPMMLQFLQCKTFGNRALPAGWLIVAAGNPPEYNRSVREFDVVTLDRVRLMNVEENYEVWKEYARKKNLHGAITSYLDLKKDHFYRMENTPEGMQFATARGWEDLAEVVNVHEQLKLPVDLALVEQYIRIPRIARDFVNYYNLYNKYRRTYCISDILAGGSTRLLEQQFAAAPFDEKIAVMGLMFSALSEGAAKAMRQDEFTEQAYRSLKDFQLRSAAGDPAAILEEICRQKHTELKRDSAAGREDRRRSAVCRQELSFLQDCLDRMKQEEITTPQDAMALCRELFSDEVAQREALADRTGAMFDHAYAFLNAAVGDGQEIVLFTTEVTSGYDTSLYVQNFGCDAYFRASRDLMIDDTRSSILEDIRELHAEA
ncbi:MAG: AAA family ATPase [Oscillospiraceae bacterium]|nr:AAA family ATPase [Oscillospiraceae bacterium]